MISENPRHSADSSCSVSGCSAADLLQPLGLTDDEVRVLFLPHLRRKLNDVGIGLSPASLPLQKCSVLAAGGAMPSSSANVGRRCTGPLTARA